MLTRKLPLLLISLMFIECYSIKAYASEAYYIDNNRVLLYKIINWWYDCLPAECDSLCGKPIKYTKQGNAKIEYNETDRTLNFKIDEGFADQLSLFKQCEQCRGPAYFQCQWLNKKLLGDAKAADISRIKSFLFENVSTKQAKNLIDAGKYLLFVIEGTIEGLMDGQMALHQAGTSIRKCPMPSNRPESPDPTILKIIDARTNEIIAEYNAQWER